jgi:FO synthase
VPLGVFATSGSLYPKLICNGGIRVFRGLPPQTALKIRPSIGRTINAVKRNLLHDRLTLFDRFDIQTHGMREILRECLEGKNLSRAEVFSLLAIQGDEFESLLDAAALLRDGSKGKIVTFSPKVFIPLTNLCRDFCGYCTFRRAPGEPGAKTMTLEEVLTVVRQGQRLGCTEALFSLGDKPEAIYPEMSRFLEKRGLRRTLDYLYDACQVVLKETGLLPHCNAGVMGKKDLQRLKGVNGSMGLMLESSSDRLMLPGGPHDQAPDKKPSVRLRMLQQAGELRIPFTTGVLIGIGERWEERIDSLLAIRALHERYHHIQEVIVQNFRVKPTIPMRHHAEPDLAEMLKMIALTRLVLGGDMNIQAPPNLTPENYDCYLRAGINDWGGVSPLTPDFINPEAPWPALAALKEKSARAGFTLKARLPIYPEYIRDRDEFIPPTVRPYVERLCAADGFVKEGGPLGAKRLPDRRRLPAA